MPDRWGLALNIDPAYSPNLAIGRLDFGYAWPAKGSVAFDPHLQ